MSSEARVQSPIAAAPSAPQQPANATPVTEAWRLNLNVDDIVCLRSASAGGWLHGRVKSANRDRLLVEYNVGGELCEKKMLRSSPDIQRVSSAGNSVSDALGGGSLVTSVKDFLPRLSCKRRSNLAARRFVFLVLAPHLRLQVYTGAVCISIVILSWIRRRSRNVPD